MINLFVDFVIVLAIAYLLVGFVLVIDGMRRLKKELMDRSSHAGPQKIWMFGRSLVGSARDTSKPGAALNSLR